MSILFSLTIAKGAWVTCKANRGDQPGPWKLDLKRCCTHIDPGCIKSKSKTYCVM